MEDGQSLGRAEAWLLYRFHDPGIAANTVQKDHTTDGHNGDVKKAPSKRETQGLPWRSSAGESSGQRRGHGFYPLVGKIPGASWPETHNMKQEQHCNKFKKDFQNGLH